MPRQGLPHACFCSNVVEALDQTEAVFLSSITRLHCYACLASACLSLVFVLMWTQLNFMNIIVAKPDYNKIGIGKNLIIIYIGDVTNTIYQSNKKYCSIQLKSNLTIFKNFWFLCWWRDTFYDSLCLLFQSIIGNPAFLGNL